MGKLTREQLTAYAGFLEKNFWNMQGNWMLNITNSYGTEIAADFDAKVFDRNGKVQAWKIKEALELNDSMKDFAKAMTLSTLFSNVELEFPEISENRVQLLVTHCVMQMNRRNVRIFIGDEPQSRQWRGRCPKQIDAGTPTPRGQ